MLHAELHRKTLDDNPDRREDVLTSSVFGTLFIAGANDVLVEWLNRARYTGASHVDIRGPLINYWFWPTLRGCQPDLLIQYSNALVIVEAKYHSGKSSTVPTADLQSSEQPSDQLVVMGDVPVYVVFRETSR